MKGVKVSPVASEHCSEDKVAEDAKDRRDEEHEALQPPLQSLKQLHLYFQLY